MLGVKKLTEAITGVASLQSERKFIGVEIDKEYFSISEEKLKNIEVVKRG